MRIRLAVLTLAIFLFSCSKPTASNSEAAAPGTPASVDYAPKIGIAVRTGSRTCMTIRNGAIPPDTPVTLVSPANPQSFVEGTVKNQAVKPCPISQDVRPDVTSYEISLENADTSKLIPMIAVMGTAASNSFTVASNGVQADLSQMHRVNTFRACGADDGVHVTVWNGVPLTGSPVWSGHYFEEGNPGTLPTCTTGESGSTPPGPDR